MNTQTQTQPKTPKPVPEFVRLLKIEEARRAEKRRQESSLPRKVSPSPKPRWTLDIKMFGRHFHFQGRIPEPVLPNPPGSSQYRNFLKHAEIGGMFDAVTCFLWAKLWNHEVYYDENGCMYERSFIYL